MLVRTDISKCPVCICADSHDWEYGLCQGHHGSPGSTPSDPLYNLTEWENNRFRAFWLRSSVEPRQHGWGFPSLQFLLPIHWPTSAEWIYDLPTFLLLPTWPLSLSTRSTSLRLPMIHQLPPSRDIIHTMRQSFSQRCFGAHIHTANSLKIQK